MLDSASPAEDGDTADEVLTWRIEGMDCASCVAKVRTAVERLPGISSVEVNLMAERLSLHRSTEGAEPTAIERQIETLGYHPIRFAVETTNSHRQEARAKDGADPDLAGHEHGGGAHAGHMHAHSEAEEAEERAGVPWWRTGKAKLAARWPCSSARHGACRIFPREATGSIWPPRWSPWCPSVVAPSPWPGPARRSPSRR